MWIDFLRLHGERTPGRSALVIECEGEVVRRLTYGELDREACTWAARFHEKGVGKGDRVALLATNSLEHLTMFFACTKLGAIFVPLNFRLAPLELHAQLDQVTPKLYYSRDSRLPGLDPDAVTNTPDISLPEVTVENDDCLLILFTSGSTGTPKGVMLHAEMLLWNAINTHTGWALQSDDISVVQTPFFHTGGYNVTCLPLLRLGGALVLTDCFNPAHLLRTIARERVSALFAVPAMLRMMQECEDFDTADLSSLRFCISGGAPCPANLIETYRDRGVPLKQGFGLTEVGPNCFYMSDEEATRRSDSVGRPMLHSHVKLVDESGLDVSDDQVGELAIAGPHVCKGYWNNHKVFETVFRNGYFHTGDLMRRNTEGFFYVVGRRKEMYISGGENVYPGEVVTQLVQHPAVVDAVIVATPDPKWGEVGFAFVRCEEELTLEAMREFLNPRLSRYKHPRHLRCLHEFPLLPNGKVDRQALLEQAQTEVAHG